MFTFARTLVLVASTLLAARAGAAPGLAVGPFEGDRQAALPTQLAGALCARFTCTLWPSVSTRGKVDAVKVKAAGVAGVLVGRVERQGGQAAVSLSLVDGVGPALQSWRLPLAAGGRLGGADLQRLERELAARLLEPRAAPLPAPVATSPPPAQMAPAPIAPAPPAATPPAPPAPRPAAPPPASPAPADRTAPPAAPATPSSHQPSGRFLAAVEVGAFLAKRDLSYGGTGASSGTLYGFGADSITGATLRLELFPWARRGEGVLSGLGVTAAYGQAIGLETVAPGGERRSTSFSQLEAGLAWRSAPLGGLRVTLEPSVGYRRQRLAVSPAVDGLPDADLSGARLGLAAEVALGRSVALRALAGYTFWLTARDLVEGEPAFFPGDGASGLDLALALEVALGGRYSARLAAAYDATSYSLAADPSGTYAASSASDTILSGRASLRATF
jgi:hypothetical protein